MDILAGLFKLQDAGYADFQSKLTPSVPRDKFIGVRVPDARKLARKYSGTDAAEKFMQALPHEYYDENMLHGLLISEIKDYEECIEAVDSFLPYVDNWAVCDIMSPKAFKTNKDKLIKKIIEWTFSGHTYECRFAVGMLLKHFLDDAYKEEYLDIPAAIRSEEYYVRMMQAWFFATALAKQWDDAVKYIEEKRLDIWVHNKTIRKSVESLRITKEQKEYLKRLKRDKHENT